MEFTKCGLVFFIILRSYKFCDTAVLNERQIEKEFQSLKDEIHTFRNEITTYYNKTKLLNISVIEGCGTCVSDSEIRCPTVTNHDDEQDTAKKTPSCKSILVKYDNLVKAFVTEKKLNQELQSRVRSMEDIISVSNRETGERFREVKNRLGTLEESMNDTVSDIYRGIRINITLSNTANERIATDRDRVLKGRLRSIENAVSNIYRAITNNVTLLKTASESLDTEKDLELQSRLRAMEKSMQGIISDNFRDLRNSMTSFLSTVNDKIDELFIKADQTSAKPNLSNCRTVPESGVYTLYPESIMPSYTVYCDQDTNGGGWIVFMRRQDGSVNFTRSWSDYKLGFGSPNGEFWAGNDMLHKLTRGRPMKLRIDMEDFNGNTKFAVYDEFQVGAETDKYRLYVRGYSGTAGDSLIDTVESHHRHTGMQFTTFDSDNDYYSGNCAEFYKGGWWYNYCFVANLNGLYSHDKRIKGNEGIIWYPWTGSYEALKRVEMKIR